MPSLPTKTSALMAGLRDPSEPTRKERYTLNRAGERGAGSVQIAVFGEEDVRAGKLVTDEVRPHQLVTQIQDTDDMSGAPGK